MSTVRKKLKNIIKTNRISAVWIIPILTVFIGLWILYTHFSQEGKTFTIIASDANNIVAGKTIIKSRSVEIGIVKSVTLSEDFHHVIIKGQINKMMNPLLTNDALFWIVKPQVGREGITGINTLFSGIYIELMAGNDESLYQNKPYTLLDSPPISNPLDSGIHINLKSNQNEVIPKGSSVNFRGFKVGTVETSDFDIKDRKMKYQLFINKPYDLLITKNIRFWREGDINFSISSSGANLNIPPIDALLSGGGVSFDVPEGSSFGEKAEPLSNYVLYENKNAINGTQYTKYTEFLLLFSDSISGLTKNAPVEYRGIRLGTVSEAPFYTKDMKTKDSFFSDKIPVLIRIEPERIKNIIDDQTNLNSLIMDAQKRGLRASLKSNNLLTNSLYVDLDFQSDISTPYNENESHQYGYYTIATVSTGLAKLQSKIIQTLNNFNKLPLNKTVNELNQSLEKSQNLLDSLNSLIGNKDITSLPKEIKTMIESLNITLKSVQPGSELQTQLKSDLQKFEQTLDQLTPVLDTLNSKSNALIFAVPNKVDPQPKAKGNR